MAEEINTLTGTISIPLHGNDGKSAYEVACDLGYTGTAEEWLARILKNDKRVWDAASDVVSSPKTGEADAPLADFETESYEGDLFLVSGDSDTASFDTDKYNIHGSNGCLNVGDYILRLNGTWVRLSLYEAKDSTLVNSDGKYSPLSGVDGLFSSTQAAYLTDLINSYWGKEKLQVYTTPVPEDGWLVNWCCDNAFYLGGFSPDCSSHPPVLNDNNTSWVLLNLNGMRMSENDEYYNHRLQVAFDLVNNLIYMRRGWISTHEFTDWVKVGDIAQGSITQDMLSDEVRKKLDNVGYIYLPDTDGVVHKGTIEMSDAVAVFVYDE